MGLDITSYKNITEAVGNEAFDETGELIDDDNWVQFYVNPDYPQRADDIHDQHAYKYESSDRFRAGSYSGYNRWRDMLAELAGYPVGTYTDFNDMPRESYAAHVWHNVEEGPFVELISFSDCEGVIGAKTCAKLAKDFAEFQEKADEHEDDYFKQLYNRWREAFEMAAENGAIEFH